MVPVTFSSPRTDAVGFVLKDALQVTIKIDKKINFYNTDIFYIMTKTLNLSINLHNLKHYPKICTNRNKLIPGQINTLP